MARDYYPRNSDGNEVAVVGADEQLAWLPQAGGEIRSGTIQVLLADIQMDLSETASVPNSLPHRVYYREDRSQHGAMLTPANVTISRADGRWLVRLESEYDGRFLAAGRFDVE